MLAWGETAVRGRKPYHPEQGAALIMIRMYEDLQVDHAITGEISISASVLHVYLLCNLRVPRRDVVEGRLSLTLAPL